MAIRLQRMILHIQGRNPGCFIIWSDQYENHFLRCPHSDKFLSRALSEGFCFFFFFYIIFCFSPTSLHYNSNCSKHSDNETLKKKTASKFLIVQPNIPSWIRLSNISWLSSQWVSEQSNSFTELNLVVHFSGYLLKKVFNLCCRSYFVPVVGITGWYQLPPGAEGDVWATGTS